MEKSEIAWPQYVIYILVMLMVFFASTAFGQITAMHFNAEWNKNNGVSWFMDLQECKTKSIIDIAKQPKMSTKYKIAVIPTIIIFKDDEEVARFQADLSFKMVATKEEVQEEIDNIIMSDF
tara:strand:+ start:4182 stop:4544 length:363 start_codon:yes stop_codon:yes gene_type:complete